MCCDMVKQASYVKFDKLLSAALVIVCTSQLTVGDKSSDVSGIMLPKVKQRVIEAGSDFNVTCIYKKIPQSKYDRGGSQKIKWKLPDSVHHHKDVFLPDQNETHVISLVRVTDAKPSDTGTYRCNLQFYSDLAFEQHIYVFSKEEPIVFDNIDTRILGKLGLNELVPCKPTNPAVRLMLKRINLIERDGITERKLGPDLLTSQNSKWKVEPKRGLVLNKVTFDDMGNYSCLALNYNISIDFKIDVLGLELTRVESEKRPVEGDNITLICRSRLLTWPPEWSFSVNQSGPSMEDIDKWRLPEGIHIETSPDNLPILESRLFLTNFSTNSPIFFRCSAFDNETDCMDYQQTINVLDTDSGKQLQQLNFIKIDHAIYPIVLMILLIVGISITIRFLVSKKHKVFPQGSDLLKGKPIEENLPVDEQIESIPYDKRWEFPQHRLKLGIQLGVGCFGRVVKAEAVGIERANEAVKTVAVKMVRSKNNFTALEALISELKILIYLGSHLNVVNLLGACTKNITKGELLVIVEYCRFGSLQTYLNSHRSFFVNQVDQFGNLTTKEEEEGVGITKRSNYYMTDGGVENQGLEIVEDVLDQREIDTDVTPTNANFNMKSKSYSIGNKLKTSKSSTAPHWYYEESSDVIPCNSLTTRDLMCWSFQIARGMDYLASKHVFHGDLAARNVLLADDGVVKVADFGMAHKMYYEASYQKSGQGLLPVKWMALESLTDRIFSSQSDVWSYGVLLWELFTLGKVPYPGMDASHILIKELQNGYRMEKPEYAPNLIGEIMSSCWKVNSKDRPTFNQIDETICRHLESTICSYYLDLNISYLKLNDEPKNSASEVNFGQTKLLDSQEKHCQIIVVNQQADKPGIFKMLSSNFTNKA